MAQKMTKSSKERGSSITEYCLMLGFICLGITASLQSFHGSIETKVAMIADNIAPVDAEYEITMSGGGTDDMHSACRRVDEEVTEQNAEWLLCPVEEEEESAESDGETRGAVVDGSASVNIRP